MPIDVHGHAHLCMIMIINQVRTMHLYGTVASTVITGPSQKHSQTRPSRGCVVGLSLES